MIQLAGPPRLAGQQPRGHPRALGPMGAWRQACAVRVRLSPGGGLITLATLQRYEREHGSLPNGCVLLLDAQWTKDGDAGPGIALDAAQYLLQQAPALQGVGLNAPRLDAPNAGAEPVKNLLLSKGLIVVEALGNLRRLPTDRFWLLVLASPGCGTTTRPTGASGNLLLAILPR